MDGSDDDSESAGPSHRLRRRLNRDGGGSSQKSPTRGHTRKRKRGRLAAAIVGWRCGERHSPRLPRVLRLETDRWSSGAFTEARERKEDEKEREKKADKEDKEDKEDKDEGEHGDGDGDGDGGDDEEQPQRKVCPRCKGKCKDCKEGIPCKKCKEAAKKAEKARARAHHRRVDRDRSRNSRSRMEALRIDPGQFDSSSSSQAVESRAGRGRPTLGQRRKACAPRRARGGRRKR